MGKINNLLICIYAFYTGGIEKLTVDFVNYCKKNYNFNIYIACVNKSGELLADLNISNDNIFEMGGGIFPKQLLKGIYRLKKIKKILPNDCYVLSQGEVPNLIVPHVFTSSRYVLVEHNTKTFVNTKGLYNAGWFALLWAKFSYSRAKKIIAISDGVKQAIIKGVPWKKNSIRVVYNFFDFNTIKEKSAEEIDDTIFLETNSLKLVTVGRLFRAKDHITMLKAFKIIKKEIDVKLFIIGEGEERKNIQNFINDNNLQQDCFLLGIKENPYKYMKHANLFLLSSTYEGFPLVLYEALISSTKVVTTESTSDMKKLITKECGDVVPIGNYKNFAHKTISLLNSKSTKIKKLPNHFNQFKLEYAVKKYLDYITE